MSNYINLPIVTFNTLRYIIYRGIYNIPQCLISIDVYYIYMGHGGALVESIAFNRRVVGSTPALAAM